MASLPMSSLLNLLVFFQCRITHRLRENVKLRTSEFEADLFSPIVTDMPHAEGALHVISAGTASFDLRVFIAIKY